MWKKGESGNPYGRRPGVNVFKKLCQSYSQDIFRILWEMFENPNSHPAVRFQIGKFMQEQGYGRAQEALKDITVIEESPEMMTTEQLKLAAAGQTQELVCNLIESGKIDGYTRMVDNALEVKHGELLEHSSADTDVAQDKTGRKVKSGKGKK